MFQSSRRDSACSHYSIILWDITVKVLMLPVFVCNSNHDFHFGPSINTYFSLDTMIPCQSWVLIVVGWVFFFFFFGLFNYFWSILDIDLDMSCSCYGYFLHCSVPSFYKCLLFPSAFTKIVSLFLYVIIAVLFVSSILKVIDFIPILNLISQYLADN